MSLKIRRLSSDLASQIAAGEVVERPASAVKELVENALDAGATRCDVEIEGGGISRILVHDDGSGMAPEDAELCVERHATSKLVSLDQLSRIESYGFRGEALPSIASVSRFTLTTRPRGSDEGVELVLEGGGQPRVRPVGCAIGTRVEIKDLFFNVPARRKFLRSAGTESGHVADVLEAAALSRPDVTFTLLRDGRRAREWLRAGSRGERAQAVLDEELASCTGERGPLQVEAYLSRPERARAGTAGLRLFVNERPVKDRALALTVAQAYGSVLERGRYPRGVVYVTLPPTLVDVNVHPQKTEVRFSDPRAVTDAIYRVLSLELASAFSLPAPARNPWANRNPQRIPGHTPQVPEVEPRKRPQAQGALDLGPDPWGLTPTPSGPKPTALYQTAEEPQPVLYPEPDRQQALVAVRDAGETAPIVPEAGVPWASLRFVAQVRSTYLICEGTDALYILDQHAAAERVTFDRLRREHRSRNVPSQALLFPLTLDVTGDEAELVDAKRDELAALGFALERRGPDVISVHGHTAATAAGPAPNAWCATCSRRCRAPEAARSRTRSISPSPRWPVTARCAPVIA